MMTNKIPGPIRDWLIDKDLTPEDMTEDELYTVAVYLMENYDAESGFEKNRHAKQSIKRFVEREKETHENLVDFIDSICY